MPIPFERRAAAQFQNTEAARFAGAQIADIAQVPHLPLCVRRVAVATESGFAGWRRWAAPRTGQDPSVGQNDQPVGKIQQIIEIRLETPNGVFANRQLRFHARPPKWRNDFGIVESGTRGHDSSGK